jgi:hypothetical protein
MRIMTILFAIALWMISPRCTAQTAEEWRRAAGSTGCGLIVWDRMREECVSRQSDMKSVCERGDLSCRPLGYKKKNQDREKLVRDLQDAKSANNSAEVEKKERELSTLDSQIKGNQTEAARREEVNQACGKARRYVMALFDDAVHRVEGMRNSDSNKEFFNDMDSNREKLKRSIETHAEEVDKAAKRAAECRDAMNFE